MSPGFVKYHCLHEKICFGVLELLEVKIDKLLLGIHCENAIRNANGGSNHFNSLLQHFTILICCISRAEQISD